MAAPLHYSAGIGELICQKIEEGQTIRDITAIDGMPSWPTIRKWLRSSPEFATQYARAYEASAHSLADEALRVVRSANDAETSQVARVRLDAIKWLAGKRNPKVYGEKQQLELSGELNLAGRSEDDLRSRLSVIWGTIARIPGDNGGTGAPAIAQEAGHLLPSDGATEAGTVSEASGVLRGGSGAPGEAVPGRKPRRKDGGGGGV
jgi:hypothetical protein